MHGRQHTAVDGIKTQTAHLGGPALLCATGFTSLSLSFRTGNVETITDLSPEVMHSERMDREIIQ